MRKPPITARAGDLARIGRGVPYLRPWPRSAQHSVRSDPGGRAAAGRCRVPVWAHPHVFIDAGISLMTDDDRRTITSVEVTWLYDELYTLILLQDYELDGISTAR
jgi:hypothetical protein